MRSQRSRQRESSRLGEAVYRELRGEILSRRLRSGQRLREEQLAERMGVSRTPVREAIGRLEAEGLAVPLPRRGLVVAEVTPEHVMEIYTVRETLEGTTSRLAARHITPLEVVQLEQLLAQMSEAVTRDDTEAMESLNRQFHALLYRASKNRLLQRILEWLWDDLRRFGVTTFAFPGRKKEALEEHRALADAIMRGDEVEAERLARQHLAAGRQVRLQLLYGQTPGPSASPTPPANRVRLTEPASGAAPAS